MIHAGALGLGEEESGRRWYLRVSKTGCSSFMYSAMKLLSDISERTKSCFTKNIPDSILNFKSLATLASARLTNSDKNNLINERV